MVGQLEFELYPFHHLAGVPRRSKSAFSSTYYLSRTSPHPLYSMMDYSYGIAQFADDTGFWFSSTSTRHLVRNLTQILNDLLALLYVKSGESNSTPPRPLFYFWLSVSGTRWLWKFQDDPFILGLYPPKLVLPVLHWTLHSTSKCTSHHLPLLEPWTTGTKSAPPASQPHFTPQPNTLFNFFNHTHITASLEQTRGEPPWTAHAELYDHSETTSTTLTQYTGSTSKTPQSSNPAEQLMPWQRPPGTEPPQRLTLKH